MNPLPMNTMMSKAQCNSVFGPGWSEVGTVFSPVTWVSVEKPTRKESRSGIEIPYFGFPPL